MHRGAFSEDDDQPQRFGANFRNKLLTSRYRLLLARSLITRGTEVSKSEQSSHPADSPRNWRASGANHCDHEHRCKCASEKREENLISDRIECGRNAFVIYTLRSCRRRH